MSSIIIFAVIYIVATLVKSTMKRAAETFDANRPGQIPAPVPEAGELDEVDDNEADDEAGMSIGTLLQALEAKAAEVKARTQAPATTLTPKPAPNPVAARAEQSAPKASREEDTDANEVTLRTPEEARRAFIYSEIFNRKYE